MTIRASHSETFQHLENVRQRNRENLKASPPPVQWLSRKPSDLAVQDGQIRHCTKTLWLELEAWVLQYLLSPMKTITLRHSQSKSLDQGEQVRIPRRSKTDLTGVHNLSAFVCYTY